MDKWSVVDFWEKKISNFVIILQQLLIFYRAMSDINLFFNLLFLLIFWFSILICIAKSLWTMGYEVFILIWNLKSSLSFK